MRLWKMSASLLALAGLTLMIGCGGKKEEAAAPPPAGSNEMVKPPPGIADQIKSNPAIPADQKAKYGGK